MSSSKDQQLSIISIPHDVIRRVIRAGQEDIDVMLQISPQWNTLAREHLNNWKHLPVIRYICWATNDDGQTKLTISVLEKFRKYFHLDNWQLKYRIGNEIEVVSGDFLLSSLPKTRAINRIFGRCSRIENIEVQMNILRRKYAMNVIKNAIIGVYIGRLDFKREFTLSNADTEHAIMDLIGGAKVERVAIIKRTLSQTDHDVIISVVSRFLRRVSTMEFISRDIDDVDETRQPQYIQLLQQPFQGFQQQVVLFRHDIDDTNRNEWRNFNGILNCAEKLKANFYEETLPNGRVKFSIDISIKEA